MHPILFKIGPVQLYTYGALLATAFLAALYVATREAEREGIKSEFVADSGILIILSSILGARLFYIVFYDLQNTLANPRELLKLQQTGLVFYGGFIFAAIAVIVHCKRKSVPIPLTMDIAAPGVALGQAIGRIGCLMSGCCYGKPAAVPWAIKIPHLDHFRHPTQVYESLATFAIFLVLIRFRRRKTGAGQVAWLYLMLYALTRFVIEFFRGDNPQILLGLTISQVLAALVLIGVLPFGYFVWRPKHREGVLAKGESEAGGKG